MIRKFFASFFLLVFAFLMMPMALLQSFMSSFLSESRLSQKIIPATYEPVTSMFIGQFSHKPEEAKLFQERIRNAVPREKYTQLILLVIRPFLAKELPSEIDMKPLKEALKDIKFESRFADEIQKQIPQKIPLNVIKDPEVQKTLRAFFIAKNYSSLIFIGVAFIILSLQALIVFSPWSSILKWLGASIGSFALLLTLFLVSLDQLDIIATISDGFSPSQTQLLKTLIKQPLSLLTLWMFFLWSAAVLLFGSGIIFTHSGGKLRFPH
ncbi:hypothetical protein HYW83_02560 [Candidatus Peregrinibacteria bacterium]|nr:hypothetical protein [Candidatus Peregrinibacteria bacterium]